MQWIRHFTFMVHNLCQADSKVQHQNPIQKIIYPDMLVRLYMCVCHVYFVLRAIIILFLFCRYIAKTETMAKDLHTVIHSMLSGFGAGTSMNIKRPNSAKMQTYAKGRYLPLFSSLLPKKHDLIQKVAKAYTEDIQMFGYAYDINQDGSVYATCEEYGQMDNCI